MAVRDAVERIYFTPTVPGLDLFVASGPLKGVPFPPLACSGGGGALVLAPASAAAGADDRRCLTAEGDVDMSWLSPRQRRRQACVLTEFAPNYV